MTSMWAFIFFYGILFGFLVGMAFMIPIIEINKYFPGKKNYVNGCILVGTGSGSVVFGMFSYTYLNPDQLKPLFGILLRHSVNLGDCSEGSNIVENFSLDVLCYWNGWNCNDVTSYYGSKKKVK
jgi:riboflavin transporter FmnP